MERENCTMKLKSVENNDFSAIIYSMLSIKTKHWTCFRLFLFFFFWRLAKRDNRQICKDSGTMCHSMSFQWQYGIFPLQSTLFWYLMSGTCYQQQAPGNLRYRKRWLNGQIAKTGLWFRAIWSVSIAIRGKFINIAQCIANSICLAARKLESHCKSQILNEQQD